MPISEEDRRRLEQIGEFKVREAIKRSGLATSLQVSAIDWLAELDVAARDRNEAAQAEQASAASRAATAAVRAADAAEAQAWTAKIALITAIVANVIAATALIVGIISIYRSH